VSPIKLTTENKPFQGRRTGKNVPKSIIVFAGPQRKIAITLNDVAGTEV